MAASDVDLGQLQHTDRGARADVPVHQLQLSALPDQKWDRALKRASACAAQPCD